MKSLYDIEQSIDRPLHQRFSAIKTAVEKAITGQRDATILDLGSSEGFLHQYLHHFFGDALIGIDFPGYDFGLQYNKPDIQHDLNVYPYPMKRLVEVIVAGEIIEHLHSPWQFLQECRRILKPGGTLIITTPNACGIHHALENLSKTDYATPYGHIQFFTESCLRRLLQYQGFTCGTVMYIAYRKYRPLYWINKKLGGANIIMVAKAPQAEEFK